MDDLFKKDYFRMMGKVYSGNLITFFQILFSYRIRYMKLWRKANKKMTIWRKVRLLNYSRKFGLEISPNASIGKGLYLGHPFNITVADGVKLGDNINLHKGCTIGKENRGKREGTPTIGNRVYIGVNATIIGRISIGNDVMIASNSFVNFDVPDHSIVLGNPGRIHQKEKATEKYISFLV